MNSSTELYVVEALADTHDHTREVGPVMASVISDCYGGGADVMGLQPNTKKPLILARDVVNYGIAAERSVPTGKVVRFIRFVMLTEQTTRAELELCAALGIRDAKIYPYLRTTKSDHGVVNYGNMLLVVKWCGELGIKVHAHFEHPNMVHSNRDAEYLCLPIAELFLQNSDAVIIWEHGSDGRCVRVWKHFAAIYPGRFYVTLTAHHLAWDEDSAYGDVRKICKPPIKTDLDRLLLIELVSENHDWVMAGSDVAPHDVRDKHVHKGRCACGDYTARMLHPLYAHSLAHLFCTKAGLEVYINFTSRNARRLHKLPPSSRSVTLKRDPYVIPPLISVGNIQVEPPGVGERLEFQIAA